MHYPLGEVLLLSQLAALAGAETFADIAGFADSKLALLRRFRAFRGHRGHEALNAVADAVDVDPGDRGSALPAPVATREHRR